ncbi:MAG: hypothetical protein ABI609_15300 [Acidobacteriota bacterium]
MTASRRIEVFPATLPTILFAALVAATLLAAHAQEPKAVASPSADPMASCPLHAQHMAAAKAAKAEAAGDAGHQHLAAVNARGEVGMGFSQSATTHHFLLRVDGGEIQVQTNDVNDAADRDLIRSHLIEIARSFAGGDFHTPAFVHDQTPPGVPTLERLGQAIHYSYADLDQGGRVSLRTSNPEALAAVHEFLRFQIQEHQTGDSLQPGS